MQRNFLKQVGELYIMQIGLRLEEESEILKSLIIKAWELSKPKQTNYLTGDESMNDYDLNYLKSV